MSKRVPYDIVRVPLEGQGVTCTEYQLSTPFVKLSKIDLTPDAIHIHHECYSELLYWRELAVPRLRSGLKCRGIVASYMCGLKYVMFYFADGTRIRHDIEPCCPKKLAPVAKMETVDGKEVQA